MLIFILLKYFVSINNKYIYLLSIKFFFEKANYLLK